MSEKGFGKSWIFCNVCQNVIHKTAGGNWEECRHDWRPNSPDAVLKNQTRELELFGTSERSLFESCARSYQSPIELFHLTELVRKVFRAAQKRVSTIVEIGSYHGGTAEFFERYFMPEKIICIDVNFEHWIAPEGIATKIEGNTFDAETLEAVKNTLGGVEVDFLFIDGDHSLAGARNDWGKYAPLVRKGGVIAFHDTGAISAVKTVFDEVEGERKVNIVSWQGIGIVIK